MGTILSRERRQVVESNQLLVILKIGAGNMVLHVMSDELVGRWHTSDHPLGLVSGLVAE